MVAAINFEFDANAAFALAFVGTAFLVGFAFLLLSMREGRTPGKLLRAWLGTEAVVVAIAIAYLSVVVFKPYFTKPVETAEEKHLKLPAYDLTPLKSLPVQEGGRVKPLEAAAREALRQIAGREKFDKQPALAIIVQWMLCPDGAPGDMFPDWEKQEFILCDHQRLREIIYAHLAPKDRPTDYLHGKYVSPSDLRSSPGLRELIDSAEAKRTEDREKAAHKMTPEERKAEEVATRLQEYDSISRKNFGYAGRTRQQPDPFHLVALDKVPNGAWLSIGQLKDLVAEDKTLKAGDSNGKWMSIIYDRLSRVPQLYLAQDGEQEKALEAFRTSLEKRQADAALKELEGIMSDNSDDLAKKFGQYWAAGRYDEARKVFDHVARKPEEKEAILAKVREGQRDDNQNRQKANQDLVRALRGVLADQDRKRLDELRSRVSVAVKKGYDRNDPQNRMIHLDYLEARFPSLYRDALAAQPFPRENAETVLASHQRLAEAYRSNDPEKFSEAEQDFLGTLQTVSEKYGPYPGEDTIAMRLKGLTYGRSVENPSRSLIDLELQFNRVQPFMWAWVIMFFSMVFLIVSMATQSKLAYGLGLAAYLASMGFQVFGFLVRVAISGRPPVSNMYETVVWVAFMSAAFALVLEGIYRRRVIALAGAMVATLGLVLADQLPLALDPKISPLVPVLRSNYWLTIHVLTIVSSYAGGTLAWGLGNIALALLAFGTPRRDTLKTLSTFTYRAIQIAVLLLATGTFLGGWWAAESWGRFWGWDPKEVWALIALVCYVIPLHMRYIGWVKDFGLAVSAVLCYAAIVMSWYGVNFVLGAGLHSYGFGGGGPWWVFWAGLLNIEWVLVASMIYLSRIQPPQTVIPVDPTSTQGPDADGGEIDDRGSQNREEAIMRG